MKKMIRSDMPLPYNTKYSWDECFAKLILEKLSLNEFINLELSDKPDLQNEQLGIGIEATTAVPSSNSELEQLYTNLSYDLVKNKYAVNNKIKKLGGWIENGVLYHPSRKRLLDNIYDSYKKKVKLLNDDKYKIFKHNYIFITDVNLILEEELYKIIFVFKKIQEEYINKFEKAFIYRYGGSLYEMNLVNEKYKVYNISYEEISFISEAARDMVVKKEMED